MKQKNTCLPYLFFDFILEGPICKCSEIGVETNRGGKCISAVHANIYKQTKVLKIGIEGEKNSKYKHSTY